jgi:hypothetical protein
MHHYACHPHRGRERRFALRSATNCLVFVLLVAASASARADTLKVGALFPTIDFLQPSTTSDRPLVSLSDVQEKKAIVFVFASW